MIANKSINLKAYREKNLFDFAWNRVHQGLVFQLLSDQGQALGVDDRIEIEQRLFESIVDDQVFGVIIVRHFSIGITHAPTYFAAQPSPTIISTDPEPCPC